jgi:hypothetical protein
MLLRKKYVNDIFRADQKYSHCFWFHFTQNCNRQVQKLDLMNIYEDKVDSGALLPVDRIRDAFGILKLSTWSVSKSTWTKNNFTEDDKVYTTALLLIIRLSGMPFFYPSHLAQNIDSEKRRKKISDSDYQFHRQVVRRQLLYLLLVFNFNQAFC